MQIILNEQGYVKSYAMFGGFGAPFITVNKPSNFDDFEQNYTSYHLSGGVLVKNADKQKEIESEKELAAIREQREKICFSYINRGYLWYSMLDEAQKAELSIWYQAWLDVTETKIIPVTPEWLQ